VVCVLLAAREVVPGGMRSTYLGLPKMKRNAVTVYESKRSSSQRRQHCFAIWNTILMWKNIRNYLLR